MNKSFITQLSGELLGIDLAIQAVETAYSIFGDPSKEDILTYIDMTRAGVETRLKIEKGDAPVKGDE
jgi:hypothetical protein